MFYTFFIQILNNINNVKIKTVINIPQEEYS